MRFGYARRLREGGFRPPAARPPRGSGALGREPRLELGRQCPLLGDDGRRHRGSSFYGCPSIGLSLADHGADADFEAAELYAERIVRAVLERPVGESLCLNVNIPWDGPRRYAACASAARTSATGAREFYRREDPQGREYFWLTGDFVDREPEAPDTDERALAEGTCRWCRCRSISPITPAWIPLRATLGLE